MIGPVFLPVYVLIAVIGLCFGSFVTALVYRIPRNLPWIYDGAGKNKTCRSACPSCGQVLSATDLIPLWSWLRTGGKCRHCGAKISARYPAIEVFTMLAVLLQFYAWGMTATAIPVLLAVPFLIAALLIDWECMILPDDTNIALAILAVLFVGLRWYEGEGMVMDSILAAVILTGLLWLVSLIISKWKGRDALGLGDLKFLPSVGLFLGMAALPGYLALSGALGVATAILKRKSPDNQQFPFGPALIISLYIHVFLTGLGFDYKW